MSTLASRDRVVGQRMFPNLDAYRAIGMVMIMTMHVTFASGLEFRSSIGPLFARMEVGVPIFFMVSGFLLYRPHVVSVVTGGPHMPARTFLRRRALRIWFGVEQHRHQVRAGDAVDHAVMHFREQGPPAISEPFDDPHLPQRLRAVEIL